MARNRRNDPDIPRKPLSESPLPDFGRRRPGRDYKLEYARRKQKSIDRGFGSVRRERENRKDYRAARRAQGATPKQINRDLRGPAPRNLREGDTSGMDALEKADYYRLDEFSRSYVMKYWEQYGWFDSWAEAREWYYGTL